MILGEGEDRPQLEGHEGVLLPGVQGDNFPLMDALSVLLRGDGNCAEVVWSFLGISIPGWTLVAFLGLAGFNLWQVLRRN